MRERRYWNSLKVAGSTTDDLLIEQEEAMAETAEIHLALGDGSARQLANVSSLPWSWTKHSVRNRLYAAIPTVSRRACWS